MIMLDSNIPEFDPQHDRKRWVAYFDLLGTKARIATGDHYDVFDVYREAIKRLTEGGVSHDQVRSTWFSDTFLLVSTDDSGRSFAQIEQAARLFWYYMLQAHIPLRGAIAFGPMYADFNHRVFVGKAMVEAYEYGENQDWLGLVLCPSAECEMASLGIPVDQRLNYRRWQPVWKNAGSGAHVPIAACAPRVAVNDCDLTVKALQHMADECPPKDRAKYERAIEFHSGTSLRVVRKQPAMPTDGEGEAE
jgi:hypothetical protein